VRIGGAQQVLAVQLRVDRDGGRVHTEVHTK
jgi:hypothetical protein